MRHRKKENRAIIFSRDLGFRLKNTSARERDVYAPYCLNTQSCAMITCVKEP